MIRIDLRGLPKPKKGRRAAAAASPEYGGGEGPNKLVLVFVALVLVGGPNGGAIYFLNNQADEIGKKTTAAQRTLDELQAVKRQVEERQRQRDAFLTQKKAIEQLRAPQSVPVSLLTTIGETVNKTDGVWLGAMKDDGSQIAVEGVALSHTAVATLISNLKKTGYFQNIELKETVQDEQAKEVDLFNFVVSCEKKKAGA